MVPREKPDNAVSRESSSTSHVVSQYDIPEENIYIYTHPLVIKHAGLDGKIIELHGGFSSKPRLSTRGYQNMGSLFPPTDKHVYIYIYIRDFIWISHAIWYPMQYDILYDNACHIISYASKIYAHYTYMNCITLHYITVHCITVHYSTLHYSTLHIYIITYWMVVSTPLKNISQLGILFPTYGKIKAMF